jgi:predicted exporter
LFFGFVPGLIAVAVFILVGLPVLIVAATVAIHLRRWLRQKKKAQAKAAKLAGKNAARRKAPSSRERASSPQKPARVVPRRARATSPQPSAQPTTGANGEGP